MRPLSSQVMVEDVFRDAEDSGDEWADVRMVDPTEGEWDIDLIVGGGQVEYVDLRIKAELLVEFIDCLVEDVGHEQAGRILSEVVKRSDVEIRDLPG